jgi:hypothetical protein
MSILMVCLLVLATTPGFATSGAHFFSATGSVNNAGALVVNFDEAGLGNFSGTVDYTLAVTEATATYACINGGGNHPQAANKEDTNGPLTSNGSFPPNKNGRVIAAITAGPLPSSLTCPGGQKFVLASVSYSGITLTDNTNNVSIGVANISRTFINI